MGARIETKWVICAAMEPALGHQQPQPLETWAIALSEGWEPAGPSMQVPYKSGFVVFAMVQRPVNRVIFPVEVGNG